MLHPILIVPGYTNSGFEHWQSIWQRRLPRCTRVEQRDWDHPDAVEWVGALDSAIHASAAPPVLVAHSLGCIAVAHWAAGHRAEVAGALLVAPADVERDDAPEPIRGFAPIPMRPLPFPSIVAASDDDPYASRERSEAFARAWGSRFVSVGAAGHINTAAGFGPWPAGEALLAELLA